MNITEAKQLPRSSMEQSKPNTTPCVEDLGQSTGLSPERVQRTLAGLEIAERMRRAQGACA